MQQRPDLDAPGVVDHESFVEAVTPYSEAVDRLAAVAAEVRYRYDFNPGVDSIAMRELAEQASYSGAWDHVPVNTAQTQIFLLLAAGEDAMRTFANAIVSAHTPLYSYAVLGRFGLEVLGLVQWLSDPDIGTMERVRRSLNERIHSESERQRLPEEVRGRDDQTSRLLKADAVGYARTKPRKRDGAVYFAPQRPSISATVQSGLGKGEPGRGIYAYFSAIAHGTDWGLASRVETSRTSKNQAVVDVPLMISADDIGTVAGGLILVHTRAFQMVMARMGWDDDDYAIARETALTVSRTLAMASTVNEASASSPPEAAPS